jgi:hypothetical protein
MLKLVDNLLLSRSGNYSVGVQVPLPLQSLKFNVIGLNLMLINKQLLNYLLFRLTYLYFMNYIT